MIFNSIEFLVFLPIVFLLYWLVFKRLGLWWQNLFVVAASYLFYGWWDWRFLILIAITSAASCGSGLAIERLKRPKLYMWLNVVLNLGILGVFKYYDFFITSFRSLAQMVGWSPDWVTLQLVLPVGISFYTFQALSYTIDVYRRKISATSDVVAFFAYISFFPQLVAGPIERAANLLPQFVKPREFSYPQAVDGMRQMLWGLFKKMVVADSCGAVVDMVYGSYHTYGGMALLVAAILFAFQIYGDFSGYSDIAIGTAKLFGIRLQPNFKYPYFSRDISEFWRRWHISLNKWFVDYLYIPLGGSRCSKGKSIRNTFVIFLVSGLWHGANWTYVAWGCYHAVLYLPMRMLGINRKNMATDERPNIIPRLGEGVSMALTFFVVVIGWILFRSASITDAFDYIKCMFANFHFTLSFPGKYALTWSLIMIITEWIQRNRDYPLQFSGKGLFSHAVARWALYVIIFTLCLIAGDGSTDFIYFQF